MPTVGVTGFIGTGTNTDPFRPDLDASALTKWAAIDLRDDPTVTTGRCVVVVREAVTLTSSTGQALPQVDTLDRLNGNVSRQIATEIGVDPQLINGESVGEIAAMFLGGRLAPDTSTGLRTLTALGELLYRGP